MDSTGQVETIISSRCKSEIPVCKVTMQIICGGSDTVASQLECKPCASRECGGDVPVCRYVSRNYKRGDCETAAVDACRERMIMCANVADVIDSYRSQLEALCPQSSDGFDINFHIHSTAP
ncbi:MAG: hypothetical protein FGM32_10460 [Candidatus Kapabacteria bacterium]|nr:hypothetical protein [Candidatus Kapabacteria bacterium]